MPTRAAKPCAAPGCPGRADKNSRYCVDHFKPRQQTAGELARPNSHVRGYDRKWRRIRAQFIKKNPVCCVCGEPTQEVDHIIPLANGGSSKWENLQPFCKTHHSQKTVYLDGGFGNKPQR